MCNPALPLAVTIVAVATGTPVRADPRPVPRAESEIDTAWAAALPKATSWPATIKLLDQATLQIGSDDVFIPAAEANRIMRALGNAESSARYGLIVSRQKDANWLVDLRWVNEGYVRDGDAKDWQADALLDSLKQGTEADNVDRLARGIAALDVTGWVQPPRYDGATHRLLWSLALRERGAPAATPQTINYNTYALGRNGYFSLDLITDDKAIGVDKAVAHRLLGSLNYVSGKRYQDFNNTTDKVAAYGLASLVGVVAVKKLGLLAMLGALLLKAWKLGLVAIAGATAAARRFFRRGTTDEGEA